MCERLCVKACNTYLNLNYACFMCHDILYVIHVLFVQICILECLKCNDECCLVNMLRLEKPDVPVFVVLLTKSDAPIFQTGLSSFGRLSICFSNFIYYHSLVICITYYLFTHTLLLHL
jgi:hypothetical protein